MSVTSAVGGIAVAKPSVANAVVGISIAFLFGLFAIQRFGTEKLSFAFAPSQSSTSLSGCFVADASSHRGLARASRSYRVSWNRLPADGSEPQ